jgi:hypothetical protein
MNPPYPFDIGFTGFAGAGKNAASDAIYNTDVRYTRRAFADAIKEFAKSVGWDGEKDLRGRTLLQDIGMAARRYDSDAWVKYIANRLPSTAGNAPVLWTDVRFPNEAEFIKARGGIIIEVRRQGYGEDRHISEISHLDIKPDYIVNNDSTLNGLHEQVQAIVNLEQKIRIEKSLKEISNRPE